MVMKRLADINFYDGITIDPLKSPDETYELYSVPSYDNQYPEIIKGSDIGSSKLIVEENDVLICKINPRINRVWVVKHNTENPLLASSEWIVVRNHDIDPGYLKWYFSSPTFRIQLVSQVAGIGGSLTRAQPKQVSTYSVPILSFDEQKKVTETLDKLTNLISLRKKQLAKLDEIVKARFIEMFGDPFTNEKGWSIKKLGELSTKITDGVHAKPNYAIQGKPFISVVNITKGFVNFDNCKFVSDKDYKKMIQSTHPEKGDVLYTKVGTYGIPAYVDIDEDFCLYVSVCLIKPNHTKINSRFLSISMGMPYIKRQADTRIRGIGVPDLHLNQIREFDVICPHLELQKKFVDYFHQVDKSKKTIQKNLETLETLKKALMQQYFG